MEKAVAIRQRDLELQKQQYEWEEKVAEVRQKGVRDFFAEMQGQAQSAGNIFYEGMHSGLDRFSDELTKLVTGKKTSFGKMLQDVGDQMVRNSIKSGLQQGLGAISKRLGLGGGDTKKPSFRQGDPGHVWVDNPSGTQPGHLPKSAQGYGQIFGGHAGGMIFNVLGDLLPGLGSAFHSPTPDVSSTISFDDGGGMAAGGYVSPGRAYVVGERGPEPFFPGTSGTIMSNAVARRTFGGGNHQYSYSIDARGADLGASNRIARAIEMAHSSAVTTSLRAHAEQSKRTPQRRSV